MKRKIGYLLALMTVAVASMVFCTNVMATEWNGWKNWTSASQCRDDTARVDGKYRGDIASVRWACNTKVEKYGSLISSNTCALWIGNDQYASIDAITLDNMPATEGEYLAPIRYYGMCTNHDADGVVKVCKVGSVDKDNRSCNKGGQDGEYDFISQTKTVNRGVWGIPGSSTGATLDVGGFLKTPGVSVSRDGEYDVYKLTVDVFRCYGSSWWESSASDACDDMKQDITVRIKNQKYLGASSVSNRSSQTSTGNSGDYVSTGITENKVEKSTAENKKNVGDSFYLTFSHNLFTVLQTTGVSWRVDRRMSYNGVSQSGFYNSDLYNLSTPVSSASNGKATSSGTAIGYSDGIANANTDRSDNWLYFVGTPRPYSDGGADYLMRDYYEVTFKSAGTYEFCELLTVNGKTLTEVCSKVVVGGASQYYSVSNVSNDKLGGYSTTEINTGSLKTANTENATVKKGDSVIVTFSHNIYAGMRTTDVQWSLSREGLSSTTAYTVRKLSGSGLTSVTSGKANLTEMSDGYYTAAGRTGSDGNYYYIVREQYQITFNYDSSAGYNFCEAISVAGNTYTKACTKVIVGDGSSGTNLCGTWAPSSYTSSNSSYAVTSVTSRVRNSRLSGSYSGWRGAISEGDRSWSTVTSLSNDAYTTYVKPGDTAEWVNCYWPGVQKAAYSMKSSYHGSEGMYIDLTPNGNKALYTFFSPWENLFNVSSYTNSAGGFAGANPSYKKLTTGDSTTWASTNTRAINMVDVGSYFEETITSGTPVYVRLTNHGRHAWSCFPYRCCDCCDNGRGGCRDCNCTTCYRTCRHSDNYITLDSENGPVVSGASRVKVPYNFSNSTSVTVSLSRNESNDQDAVYAGEKINVSSTSVTIGTKYNPATEATYATIVRGAQVRLIAYASSSGSGSYSIRDGNSSSEVCGFVNKLGGNCAVVRSNNSVTLNESSTTGITYNQAVKGVTYTGDYKVYDVNAGNYMCFAMAVYPYTSGDATNYSDSEGDHKWYVSAPSCKKIAKKPSVQVLGASVFTGSGNVHTNTSDKFILAGKYDYSGDTAKIEATSAGSVMVFGSWAEQAVVSNGQIFGFASGAATGGRLSDNYGGSAENGTSFCKYRTTLSMANVASGTVGGICTYDGGGTQATGLLGVTISTVNRQAMVGYFAAINTSSSLVRLGGFDGTFEKKDSALGRNTYYSENVSNISGANIATNTTVVVNRSGNLNITGDIQYNGSYTAYTVPKVVIYASGNINIDCGVGRIDAILIAGEKVNTCVRGSTVYSATNSNSGAGDNNAWEASVRKKQLVVNGAIVANQIDFGRTYGNGPGTQSGVAAEVINYDTSSIIWGRRAVAGAAESDTLTTVYQHELAPRY